MHLMVESAYVALSIQILLGIGLVVYLLTVLVGENTTHGLDDSLSCTTVPTAIASVDIHHGISTSSYD